MIKFQKISLTKGQMAMKEKIEDRSILRRVWKGREKCQ